MKRRPEAMIHRRDLLGFAIAGATVASVAVPEEVAAKPVDLRDKRRPRYQAGSAEVRNFYRVNSYPVR
jgi:hypothetical protein